jgi:hypothetical protein
MLRIFLGFFFVIQFSLEDGQGRICGPARMNAFRH